MWARVGEVTARLLLSPTHALLYCTTHILHCSTSVNFASSFALLYVIISLLYHACQHSTHYCTTRHHATPYFSACPYQHPASSLSRHSPHLAHKGPLLPPPASPRSYRGLLLPPSAALSSCPDIYMNVFIYKI